MARTIQEIYDAIITEKQTKTSLNGLLPNPETYDNLLDQLTSASKVAIWRLWAYTIAVAHYTHEVLFDLFIEEANAIAAAAPAGTLAWYQKKMFQFQYGDLLQYIGNQYVYDPIDTTKQIVKRCAIEERADGIVLVKVAKEVSGSPQKLDLSEKAAVDAYAKKIKFAGTRLVVVSIDPDTVSAVYDIYYDPQIPLATLQAAVQDEINTFLKSLPFNGAFNINAFTDCIQGVIGVIDPFPLAFTNTPFGGSTTSFFPEVIPVAGWFVFADTAANMFNWIAQP